MDISEFKNILEERISGNKEIKAVRELSEGINIKIHLVGGFVRDAFLQRENFDLDFIVDNDPCLIAKKVAERFRAKLLVMDKENIINYRVVKKGLSIDFAEIFNGDIHSDLSRRDFTINSIAYSLKEKTLFDDFNGLNDLGKKVIKMVSDETFDTDPLRMLRAVRYFTTLDGFQIDKKTLSSLISKKNQIKRSSPERVKEEMDKIILSDNHFSGLSLMVETGLINTVFFSRSSHREVKDFKEDYFKNNLIHILKTLTELLNMTFFDGKEMAQFKYSPLDKKVLFYSAIILFFGRNDLQEINAMETDSNGIICVMKALRFSNLEISRVCKLINGLNPFFKLIDAEDIEIQIRRLIHNYGREVLTLIILGNAVLRASGKEIYRKTLNARINILKIYKNEGESIINPEKLIDGNDVIKILKCKKGEEVGAILKKIKELQVEKKIASRKEAIELLEEIGKNSLN